MFAKRLGEAVVLVHAVNERLLENLPSDLRDSLELYARAQLRDEWERLRALQVEVIATLRAGAPDAVLLDEAVAHHARLLVLAAQRGSPSSSRPGGVVERVVEAANAPTLVVRDPGPLLGWGRGERRLRVFVGADFFSPWEVALRWVDWLRSMGPCDVVVACLEPGMAPFPAADLCLMPLADDMALRTARKRERYFLQGVWTLLGRSRGRVRFEKNRAGADARLIQLAVEERADLMVIGTRSRRGWRRAGHHSGSRGVLRAAPLNVAYVPAQGPRFHAIFPVNINQNPTIPDPLPSTGRWR